MRYFLAFSLIGLPLSAEQNPKSLTFKAHSGPVTSIVFSRDGKIVASSSIEGTVRLWDATSGQMIREMKHNAPVWSVAFSPDGAVLATGSGDLDVPWFGAFLNAGEVRLWDAQTGELTRRIRAHRGGVSSLAFSSDGTKLITGSADSEVRIWSTRTGKLQGRLVGHAWIVTCVAISPDGKLIASGSLDETVKIWEADTGKVIRTLKHHEPIAATFASGNWVNAVKFSPDGRMLITDSGLIRVWNTDTGTLCQWMHGHGRELNDLAFTRDGKMVASGSHGDSVRLWEVRTGREIRVFTGYSDYVTSLDFSPSGTLLATGSNDGVVKVWHLQ